MVAIKFVIFDMDQVLYDYEHPVRLRLLEELTGRPAAEIDAAVWGGPQEAAAEAGYPATAEGYLAQFADLLGYPIDFDTWCDIRRQMIASAARGPGSCAPVETARRPRASDKQRHDVEGSLAGLCTRNHRNLR